MPEQTPYTRIATLRTAEAFAAHLAELGVNLLSGCFPLASLYRQHPQHAELKALKRPVAADDAA